MALALLVVLATLSGCRSFRAEVGVGVGIGAMVKVPALLHVGFFGGKYSRFGHFYDRGWTTSSDYFKGEVELQGGGDFEPDNIEFCLFILHVNSFAQTTSYYNDGYQSQWSGFRREDHVCLGLLPIFSLSEENPVSFEVAEPYGLEIALWLIPFSIHLGWNPWYLLQDAESGDRSGVGDGDVSNHAPYEGAAGVPDAEL